MFGRTMIEKSSMEINIVGQGVRHLDPRSKNKYFNSKSTLIETVMPFLK